jgi:hypothetical protein
MARYIGPCANSGKLTPQVHQACHKGKPVQLGLSYRLCIPRLPCDARTADLKELPQCRMGLARC